mmetsp:Transcript_23997/g.44526  ORF Transcript_23997/g.44526 Transcript_23997/m.44526 type:complete len:346 (-) Transcript_23997:111-1148(-)
MFGPGSAKRNFAAALQRDKSGPLSSDEGAKSSSSSEDDAVKRARFDPEQADGSNVAFVVRQATRRARPRGKGETIADCLVYGDSISWGLHDYKFSRMRRPWPSLIKSRLKRKGFRLVQSNFPGRTTVFDSDPNCEGLNLFQIAEKEAFNGLHHFGVAFSSHSPQWLIVFLGTNDLKTHIRQNYKESCNFREALQPAKHDGSSKRGENNETSDSVQSDAVTADVVAQNCAKIGLKAREMFDSFNHSGTLRIVMVVPPPIRLTPLAEKYGFDKKSETVSKQLPNAFQKMCQKHLFLCAHASSINMEDSVDGVHLNKEQHKVMADTVWDTMKIEMPRPIKPPSRLHQT